MPSADIKVYAGVDIGGTKLLALIAAPNGALLATAVAPTPSAEPADAIATAMDEAIRDALTQAQLPSSALQAVGIASAGAIDSARGVVVHSPHVPTLDGQPLTELLGTRLGVPAVIGNDATLAALGEQRFGAGQGVNDLVYITVSTGIGSGIVAGGRLILGAHGFAGEIGHMSVDAHGPYGKSTTPGAFESLCSGTALARIANERLAAGEPSSLQALADPAAEPGIAAQDIFAAMRSGDALARSIVEDAIVFLGAGLTNVVSALNPAMLIIGGGLANEWDAYITPAVELMRKQAFAGMGHDVRVVRPRLGAEAGAWGAVAIAQETSP